MQMLIKRSIFHKFVYQEQELCGAITNQLNLQQPVQIEWLEVL